MDHPTRRTVLVSAVALFGATAVTTASVADRTLVVADAESGDRLFEIPVDQGDAVTIAYTHSVEKTPIEDVYVVEDSSLRADRSVFHSFGAGLPTSDVERTEEGYVVEGTETHDELRLAPGEIAGHELRVGERRYPLAEAADGRVVLFLTDRGIGDAVTDGNSSERTERITSPTAAKITGTNL
ncbi:DUF1850 domain-containing protein [Natronococcus occultus]|uniref:DUF1850 domain-containing protein n=1 Tax=Natronococcus occultus SP4 TaxID=694430 RepID=L0JVP5_9EURY|nr:DUF1850 domain-containing protein [Natronococcus occultus]AGB35928.1 hypothetical protein Natoc_0046 [Natronococcus occultus SP4]